MPKIFAYKKHVDQEISRNIMMPMGADLRPVGVEIATLQDGLTYISVPDGVDLPIEQPAEISSSIIAVTLTAEQIAEIKSFSPHVRLINQQVQERISARYSVADEIKFIRLGAADPGYAAYNAYVEDCRAWGRAEKSKLGL